MKRILIVGEKEKGCNVNYYNAIQASHAEPVQCDFEMPLAPQVEQCETVLFPGGVDINPKCYGKENVASVKIDDELDSIELSIIDIAVTLRRQILGICRGLQILNVFFGGTLIQNVEHCELHTRDGDYDRAHETLLLPNCFLHDLYGSQKICVNSARHQAIDVLGKGLSSIQWASDGVIEAVIHNTLPIVAVQWHPERMCLANRRPDTVDGLCLFDAFVHG